MFGFRKKITAPELCPANPGVGTEAKVAFANGDRSWTEKVDLITLAADAFKQQRESIVNEKTWLHHRESGLMILPQLVSVHPLDKGGVRTVTTMQVNHPVLVPAGVFEYQHAAANSVAESISQGFSQWLQMDFVTLRETLLPRLNVCTAMEVEYPADNGKPARVRRALLGPVGRYAQHPPSPAEKLSEGQHDFCPCCLLTNSFEAFRELFEGEDFYGLRLFAARGEDGTPQADCRVNGEDFEAGADALRQYASTWPEAGFEFRKQYVVLCNKR